MPATRPGDDLRQLKRFIKEIERRYLEPHIKAAATLGNPPREEELDVAAFIVLAHGAFENFIEGLAVWGLGKIEENWIMRKRASRGTASLMMHTSHQVNHEEETESIFNVLRKGLADAKTSHSHAIKDNNGVAIKHLRTLLSPLGVDVPTDVVLVGSLNTLVKMRHQWAHQSRFGATESKSAQDAKNTVDDCIRLADQLYKNVVTLRR